MRAIRCNKSYVKVVSSSQNSLWYWIYGVDMLDKGINHVPRGREWDNDRFQGAPQNGTQLQTCELFISGVFHVVFWDRD